MFKILLVLFAYILTAGIGSALAFDAHSYDVAVIGAGCGGVSAAIQAARMGMSVAVVEESDWIGGQMTGAAVSTMDDVRRTRTGIYNEFITRVREYYAMRNTPVNVCYWGSDTISCEPWVGQKILLDMMKESGNITIHTLAHVTKANCENDRVVSAEIKTPDGKFTLTAKVFIDATETGSFIPLTGARYRVGNSIAPDMDENSVIQDITYVAVVKKYPDGLPEGLRLTRRPPGYEEFAEHFREVISKDGNKWPGVHPFNIPVFKAYRAMPDIANPNRGMIDGGVYSTWDMITRTALNWANDYPGRKNGDAGMPAKYLEDKRFRRDAERMAMAKTLSFIFYMQTELGMDDWSVDDRQGYGGWFSNDWEHWEEMPEVFGSILKHFPPFPYIRESRRIVGVETMTVTDVIRDKYLRRTIKSKRNSIALGEYPTDIHGLRDTHYLDLDLGENPADIPDDEEWLGGLFQIPMGALIPEKIDGLIAAEKNISVSRIVNGSTRLHPVTMLTGQAAGALAAESVRQKTAPRNVRPIDVQWPLLGAKDKLSIYNFIDVPQQSLWWRGVELSVIYGYLAPAAETIYGVDQEMHWLEVRDAFRRALGHLVFPKRDFMAVVTLNDFGEWLGELFGDDAEKYKSVIDHFSGDYVMRKGELATAIGEIMLLKRNEVPKETKDRAPKSSMKNRENNK